MRTWLWMGLLVTGAAAGAAGWVKEYNPVHHRPQSAPAAAAVIVKLRAQSADGRAGHDRLLALASRRGVAVAALREITDRLHVLHLDPAAGESARSALERLQSDPEVEYAELDEHRYAHATPNDTLYAQQWYMQADPSTPAAVNAAAAWDSTTGADALVIADLDTGVRYDHPDLLAVGQGGRLLPGRCFISDSFIAGAASCPSADASDPGDAVTQAEIDAHPNECPKDTKPGNSTWHGTRTAGILTAITNNQNGIAGMTWKGEVLPLRVLGKCGGLDSDIVSAMLWAAGIAVSGLPQNSRPARIINLSLGGTGTCPSLYSDAISQVTALGVLVVVSAGNEGGALDAPANCTGVAGIVGLRHIGTKVGFSSFGPEAALGAPAGNCVNTNLTQQTPCLYPITTTTNPGTTTPSTQYTSTNAYTDNVVAPNLGTSFSAPIVAGIGALMASVNPRLNSCQLIARLKEGTSPYPQSSPDTTTLCSAANASSSTSPQECICTLDGKTCGAGMANAAGAVQAALRPIAAVSVPGTIGAGAIVSLDASGSAAATGRSIASFLWSNAGGRNLTLQGGTSATASVTVPSCGLGVVRLTVTDTAGLTDTADVVLAPTSATTQAPAIASGKGACALAAPAVQVAVCPRTASVQTGSAATSFTADVINTGNTAVNWKVNGIAGGNSTVGTITSTGTYTPPASAPTPSTVSITAVSSADASVQGTAQVTISAPPHGGGGAMGWELIGLALAAASRSRARAAVQRAETMRSARSSQLR